MKINKKSILQGFMIFKNVYSEFDKRMQDEKKGKETIKVWQEVFEEIEFDYKEANDDFIKAIRKRVSKCKYVPTIAEITEEMKKIYKKRIQDNEEKVLFEVLKIENMCKLKNINLEKAINNYCNLIKQYNNEEIIEKILRYRAINGIVKEQILNTEDMFEKIME